MSGFLLDTNCVSELVRSSPDARVLQWIGAVDEAVMHLSVLTIGEVRKGVAGLSLGQKRSRLETWLELELKARFAGRILAIDTTIADRWGILAASAKRAGRALSVVDGLLAATALHHNLTLVTRNVTDFATTHVPVINPWQS